MNIAALRFAVEHATELKGGEYTVLLVLACMAHRQSAEAWPRITRLAQKARITRKYARVCLDRLIEKGYVRVGAPLKPGYPPTLRLRTLPPGVSTQYSLEGTPFPGMGTQYPPNGNSARTNDAGLKKEMVKEVGQLTRVSLSRKKRVRCAHEGCIYLTDDVFCRRHASEDTTAAKRA